MEQNSSFAAHFVGKRASALLLAHGIFLECGGLLVAAHANIPSFHEGVLSWLLLVDFIVHQLMTKSKKLNDDWQMAKRTYC